MTKDRLNRRQVLIAGMGILAGTTRARAHNGTIHVKIEALAFEPPDIEAKVGETIEWTNGDPFAHTATVKGGWEVTIPPGQKATHLVTPDDDVAYYCRFHPNMKGRIVIRH